MALKKCKECGNNVSTKAKTCPACGAPVKQETSASSGCLAIIVLGVGIAMCSGLLNDESNSNSSNTNSNTNSQTNNDETFNGLLAYGVMEDFVKERLRSPATAEFPGVFDGKADHIEYLGNNRYRIESWVDAQNAFGATIRNEFVGEIEQVDDNRWRLISLEIYER